jgi:hypothetical protein
MVGDWDWGEACYDTYAQVDTFLNVPESNEDNNVLGPVELCVGEVLCTTPAPPGGIVDNGDDGTSPSEANETWLVSNATNSYGANSFYAQVPSTYSYEACGVNDAHEVYLWWSSFSTRCASVPVDIFDGNTLLDTVVVNQLNNGGQWNVLGAYSFSGTARIVLNSPGVCSTSADAVKFVSN